MREGWTIAELRAEVERLRDAITSHRLALGGSGSKLDMELYEQAELSKNPGELSSSPPACEAEQSGVSFAGPGLVAPGSSASEGVDGPAAACATESGVGAVTRPLTCVQGSCVPEGTHTTNAAAPACEGNNYRDWWLDDEPVPAPQAQETIK